MNYTTRTVRSVEGLTQEEALVTLQEHPNFKPGTRVASITNQEGRWVAKLLEPKFSNEESFEKHIENDLDNIADHVDGDDKSESKHEKHETPLEEIKEHNAEKDKDGDKGSADKKIKNLEKKIDKLLDALGISDLEGPEGLEGPASDGPIPPMPSAAPMGGPMGGPGSKGGAPKGPELPPGSGAKLKPGEVPNKPGVTPVGSPAFASVRQGNWGSDLWNQANPAGNGIVGQGVGVHGEALNPAGTGFVGTALNDLNPAGDGNAGALVDSLNPTSENFLTGFADSTSDGFMGTALNGLNPAGNGTVGQGLGYLGDLRDLQNEFLNQANPAGNGIVGQGVSQLGDAARSRGAASIPPGTAGAMTPVASFVASRLDSDRGLTVRQAKFSLENDFATRGFRVARIKRDGDYLRALMVQNGS